MNATTRHRQSGSVLVAVMVTMMLMMIMASTIINHYFLREAEEVEDLLLQSRAYWAMMGHVNYLLSRTRINGLCGAGATGECPAGTDPFVTNPIKDEDGVITITDGSPSIFSMGTLRTTGTSPQSIASSLQYNLESPDSINGLQNGSDVNNFGSRKWAYPQQTFGITDSSNPYCFNIRGVVTALRYNGTGTPAATLAKEAGQMRVDLEVVEPDSGDCTATGVRDAIHRIQRLTVGFCITDQTTTTAPTYVNNSTNACNGNIASSEGMAQIQFITRNLSFPTTYP